MIRINLLPREDQKRKISVKIPQAATVTVIILVTVGMWAYWRSLKGELERLRVDSAGIRGEIARAKQIVQLIEQYERDKKQLKDRLTLIQGLISAQGSTVRLLDGISQVMPDDIWLAAINKVSGRLVLQGYASSHFAVANLMLALERLKPQIVSVELSVIERQVHENKAVERFEIVAGVSG
ncbi:MAG TPA: PilN domain-containing protein [Candidatus Methylomirabilis sp.]|nr:PilN domain-containing protein [Candidatus Methylomirabilis sp.]